MTEQAPVEQRIAGLTKAEFEALNAQYGGKLKIFSVDVAEGSFDLIVKRVSEIEMDVHVQTISRAKDRDQPITPVIRNFIRHLSVAPDEASISALFAAYPMAVTAFYTQISKMAGADLEAQEKTFR